MRRHQTGRKCSHCGAELHDTIVHFGEKGRLTSPYNWKEAAQAADHADVILCLGTSLKVIIIILFTIYSSFSFPSSHSHFYVGSLHDNMFLHAARSFSSSPGSPFSKISFLSLTNHMPHQASSLPPFLSIPIALLPT